ncbi:MAG: Nramp family divalent metal transporter, partial [Pseudomonadota bacterium]
MTDTKHSGWAPGPGALVAAAFIGPGTVTTCTQAGANAGFALLWVLVFATAATVVLQDMAVRLGTAARLGLGEAMLKLAPNSFAKLVGALLVFVALAVGNAAYEGGNLAGGALGIESLMDTETGRWPLIGLATAAALVLGIGNYCFLERCLVGLVLLMSLAFMASAVLVRPDWSALAAGFVPNLPNGSLLLALGLVGTTIVPYNLFLHAATVRERWPRPEDVATAQRESRWSIGLGGLVSLCILATAATALLGTTVTSAADMAQGVEPVFGTAARWIVGVGLAAAGLTSAITAPMATGYVVDELWPGDRRSA